MVENNELKDKIADKIWSESKGDYYRLYQDYTLFSAFIHLVDRAVFDDCNDDHLVFAIDELQDYLEAMLKPRLGNYSNYDKRFNNLPQHLKAHQYPLANALLYMLKKEGVL